MKVVLLFAVTGQAIIYSLLLLFIHPRSCVETTSIAETVCWSHQLFVLILRFTLTQICHLEQMMWYCLENSCKRRLFILDNVFEYCKCNLLIIMVHQLDNFVFLIFFYHSLTFRKQRPFRGDKLSVTRMSLSFICFPDIDANVHNCKERLYRNHRAAYKNQSDHFSSIDCNAWSDSGFCDGSSFYDKAYCNLQGFARIFKW